MTNNASKKIAGAAAIAKKLAAKKAHLKLVKKTEPVVEEKKTAKKTPEAKPAKKVNRKQWKALDTSGAPKTTRTPHKDSFLLKAESQRCANLGIKAYKLPEDPEGEDMVYVIEAGAYVTNWNSKDATQKLAKKFADYVESQRREAVREYIEARKEAEKE